MRLIGLALLLPACTWVTGKQFDERLPEMDDDGDGVSEAEGDCDDANAGVSPAEPEVFYDGLDADCARDDDFDEDGDGYVPAGYEGQKTAEVPGSGELPGGDCADRDAGVNPGAGDDWYSGVDENCDGVDDFDQDMDGYVEDANAGRTTEYADGTGMLPSGDCDDAVSDVYPTAVDQPYDGVDADCGGEDDYDLDLDGWVPTEMEEFYGPTEYVDGSGQLPVGDCDDADAAEYPGAPDEWYDGPDSDCAGNDDYDQDYDGFQDPSSGAGDDCDDLDDEVYPGAVERLGDTVDGDCNGVDDGFPLAAFSTYAWKGAHDPVFSANTSNLYLSIVGEEVRNGSSRYYDIAAAARWDLDDVLAGEDGLVLWSGSTSSDPSTYSIAAGQAFHVAEDYLYGVVQYDLGSSRALVLQRYRLRDGSRSNYNFQSTADYAPFDDVSLEVDDDGVMHAIGCEDTDGVLAYVKDSDITTSDPDETEEAAGIWTAACEIDEIDGGWHVYAGESTGLLDYSFDETIEDPTFTPSTMSSSLLALDLDVYDQYSEREIVLADDATGGAVHLDASLNPTVIDSGAGVVNVAMKEAVDGTKYIAYVDASGDVFLAWGTPEDGFDTVQLDVEFAADEVAVWTTGAYVLVAATGGDEVAVGTVER
ncbi:MAG: MopE-related protein [Myxococcota bacterium]